MFDLVADVPSYPQFLPWCGGARVESGADGRVHATIEIQFKGVRTWFSTDNRNWPAKRIDMQFAEGPFSSLTGRWDFSALTKDACKVAFSLDYEFSGGPIGRVIAPVFDLIAASFIDAFSARAEALYG